MITLLPIDLSAHKRIFRMDVVQPMSRPPYPPIANSTK
jgi:hypothetical protein